MTKSSQQATGNLPDINQRNADWYIDKVVQYMVFLMYITLVGLATNLFLGYCPLARMMYLLPWNRDEAFSAGLLGRVFFSPPVKGQFTPASS